MPSTISSSVTPSSSCPQSFPALGSFPMSRLFTSCGQSIGTSVSTWVLLMNSQGWFPLELTGLISLLSKGFSRVFSSTTVWKHQFFSTLGIIEMLVLSWTHDALGDFHGFALVVLLPGMAFTPTPFYSNLYVSPTVSLRVQTLPPPGSLPIAPPSAMPKLLILVCSPALPYVYLCPLPLEIILFLCIFRCLISAEIVSYSYSALSTGPGTT